MVQLLRERPNWLAALSVARTRPPGVSERRGGPDARKPAPTNHPRRVTDDLVWLREAFEDPMAHGLRRVPAHSAVAAWESDASGTARLQRLSDRHVLEAAGFLLSRYG
jgi:hypothetical protein